MFGRRRRAASNPSFNQNVVNTNSNATTAAAQAFLKNKSSNASLAAAAAGAALRSRPTTPISVADVQTKRTMRRTNSNSSMGSAVAGSVQGRPSSQLERRGSSGSMTERTFREPSPNRGSAAVPSAADAPPVPAIPKKLVARQQKRASSVEAPPMRVSSPPPMSNGRGSSLGGAPVPRRNGHSRMTSLSNVQEMPGLERTDSRGSVNFSYPTGARPMSPYGQRKLTSPTPSSVSQGFISQPKQNMVYDKNTRTFRPEAELLFYEQQVLEASRAPVKKKKPVSQPAQGSHLSQGSMDGRPKGTAVNALEAARVASPVPAQQPQQPPPQQPLQQQTKAATPVQPPPVQAEPETSIAAAPKKKKKKKVALSDSEASMTSDADIDSDASERPVQYNTRAGALLARKPSTIREGDEDENDDTNKVLGRQAALRKLEGPGDRPLSPSLPKSSAGRGKKVAAVADEIEAPSVVSNQPPQTTESPVTVPAQTNGLAVEGRQARVQSVSPARKAHFLSTSESPNLAVRHSPPARSISPRKSALKHSPSRSNSPLPDMPGTFIKPGHGSMMSETSDTSTITSETLGVAKKKSVRVSFDDEANVVVGRAAPAVTTDSPVIASPQTKKGWFSSMGRKKKGVQIAEEDDEKMTPRPALPSFGSVREKKPKEAEERALVKPAATDEKEEKEAELAPASPIFTTATGEAIEYPLSQSNDHGIGAVIAQDATTKNSANISKVREPLPPEVTTVDGSGYHSDASSVYDTEVPKSAIGRSDSVKRGPEDGHAETYRALASPVPEDEERTVTNGHVPEFQLTQPTPIEESDSKKEWPEMPGGFPGTSSSESGQSESVVSAVEHVPTEPSLADSGISEPDPVSHSILQPVIADIPPPIMEETEESERDSLYSDAAEDLSDIEGDGFMSLNAVVESPLVPPKAPALSNSTPPESPTTRVAKERAFKKSQLTRKTSEPDMDEGWEKAQEYWSGLTADKKREMELAALQDRDSSSEEESSEDEDEEKHVAAPIPAPVLKPALKKKNASPATANRAQPANSERTYQIQPGQKAADRHVPPMRSSMRTAPPANTADDGHMRKSMRDGGGSMRSSMRGSMRENPRAAQESAPPPEPKGALQKKLRPLSVPPPEPVMDPAEKHRLEVQKHVRALSAASAMAAAAKKEAAASMPQTLRRRGSDASDSSFKRSKRKGDEPMRGSMRNSGSIKDVPSRPQSPELTKSSRFSIRSLSPTGSAFRRPFSSGGPPPPPISMSTGRTTMRNRTYSNESNTATLRSIDTDRAKSPVRTSFFGSKKPPKASKPKPAAPARSSRFADSSDEDDAGPSVFRSRFVDSSDEDEPAPIALPRQRMTTMRANPPAPASQPAQSAVRSIPRPAGLTDGDSDDLDDSDDEKAAARSAKAKPTPISNEGSALASGSLRRSGSGRETLGHRPTAITTTTVTGPSSTDGRPQHKRRGSFMSSILGRKKDKASKVQKSTAESPARRDTPLERTNAELQAVRSTSGQERVASPRPKLQKRNTGSYGSANPIANGNMNGNGRTDVLEMGANWPLAKEEGATISGLVDENGRPFTSDGVEGVNSINGINRPDMGTRRVTDLSQVSISAGAGGVGKKKKKKFGMLRKAFGLDV